MSILKIELKEDIWVDVDKSIKLFIGKKANKFFSQNKEEYTKKNVDDFHRQLEVDRTIRSKFWGKGVIIVDIQPAHTISGIIDRFRCLGIKIIRIFSERSYQEFIDSSKGAITRSVISDLKAEIIFNIFRKMHSHPGMSKDLMHKMFDSIDGDLSVK